MAPAPGLKREPVSVPPPYTRAALVLAATAAAAPGVVARAGLAALRATRLSALLDEDLDRAGRDVEDHVRDLPGWGDAEDLGVELAVAHGAKVRATGAAPRAERLGLPTRFPEDPFFGTFFGTYFSRQREDRGEVTASR